MGITAVMGVQASRVVGPGRIVICALLAWAVLAPSSWAALHLQRYRGDDVVTLVSLKESVVALTTGRAASVRVIGVNGTMRHTP